MAFSDRSEPGARRDLAGPGSELCLLSNAMCEPPPIAAASFRQLVAKPLKRIAPCKAKRNNEKFGICSLSLWKACSRACGMSPKCLCTSMGKSLHYQARCRFGQWYVSAPVPVECLFLGNSSLKMLTSSQEQKQSRDEIYGDAESTCEINASLSFHNPSSLCFKSGTM